MNLIIRNFLLGGLILAAKVHAAQGIVGVVNKADGTASLIDIKSKQIRTVKVGRLPHEIVIGKDHAFVSNYGSAHIRSSDLSNQPGNTISVIPLSDSQPTSEIDLGPARCAPHGLAVSKDGRRLYVTCEGRHEIAVVDVTAARISHFIPTNQSGSHLIVISSDEARAYVSNFWHGTVSVIDLKARGLIEQIRTGRGSEGIGLTADDRFVFVTRVEDNELVKLDTQTLKVVQRKALPQGSSPIRVTPGRAGEVLVNNVGAGTLSILSDRDLSVIREVKVGRQPIGLAASTARLAFVANMKDNNLMAIDTTTGLVESVYPTGAAPDGIAYRE